MKVWASLHKNNRVILRAEAQSEEENISIALQNCLEQIYKELDIAEPVWVEKHARELSSFKRTTFRAEDFLEPISFDLLEIEFLLS